MNTNQIRIEVKVGKTINLGNYETSRLDVSLAKDYIFDERNKNTVKDTINGVFNYLERIIEEREHLERLKGETK